MEGDLKLSKNTASKRRVSAESIPQCPKPPIIRPRLSKINHGHNRCGVAGKIVPFNQEEGHGGMQNQVFRVNYHTGVVTWTTLGRAGGKGAAVRATLPVIRQNYKNTHFYSQNHKNRRLNQLSNQSQLSLY